MCESVLELKDSLYSRQNGIKLARNLRMTPGKNNKLWHNAAVASEILATSTALSHGSFSVCTTALVFQETSPNFVFISFSHFLS